MCELLAMSAKLPTDIRFSFQGFVCRGGDTGPHKDGFGICFYEGAGVREFKDYAPSCESPIATFLQTYPIKSTAVISHIRQANVGQLSLENTHPFQREMCGRTWTYAHNGQMNIDDVPEPTHFKPVGQTDSEKIFCWIMSELKAGCVSGAPMTEQVELIEKCCHHINQFGVSNVVMSDGASVFVFCSTSLHWITRRPPFGLAHLKDADISIDFSSVTTEQDVVTVIATQPLTDNETWQAMKPGESRLFEYGECVRTFIGPSVLHKKQAATELSE